jgi:DNA-binding PucR family transcriptional regulator
MDGPLGELGTLSGVAGHVFLELLARDAELVDFEEPLRAARGAGAAPAVIAELEQAKLLALRVRSVLEHRRRRESELSALVDTAGDLAAQRDLDGVLRAIVRRARILLRTDVAYLSLIDEERAETYMRVTEGSVSARFQAVRLPLGKGLGGLVAQTARPYATADYFDDARFQHTTDIDGAVIDEGLVAILGVPLRLGARVIGVLYAADRSERPFPQEDVALLTSLAAHAAVAIDNARLLDETRATLADLNRATETIRAHSSSVERAAEAHDRLADLVLRGGDVDDVAAAVGEVLGGSLLVLDADGRIVAASGGAAVRHDADDPTLAEMVAVSRSKGRAVGVGGHWVACVSAGSEQLGALVLRRSTDLDAADQRILERAALVTALLLLFGRSIADAESRVRGELLEDLLTAPDRDPQGLLERARRLGVDLSRPHAVVVVEVDGVPRQRLAFGAAMVASSRDGLAGVHEGRAVLLLPDVDPGEAARTAAGELAAGVGSRATAGAAGAAGGPAEVAAAHREAARCLAALRALGRHGDAASSSDLGFLGLVLGDRRDVPAFVAATIGPVADYDTRRGTQLVRTLEEYFGNGGNLARTSDGLHVHVNTVTQRLDRIGRLLGRDWQSPERALEVQLALRLHRLAG